MDSRSESDGGTVLVTGARGFTGEYVLRDLRRNGYAAIGAVVSKDVGESEVFMDLCDPPSVHAAIEAVSPVCVVHLAAISFVQHKPEIDFYRTNVIGSSTLLDALAAMKVAPRKVVVASSANVYGNAAAGTIDEDCPPAPVNHYAVSKLAMEHIVRTYYERLPIVVTRPFNYTGVGQTTNFLVPKLVDHFRRRSGVIDLGNLDVERDFSDVRAVASIYRRLMESSARSLVVNVASGGCVSLQWILDQLAELSGHRPEIRSNPEFRRANEIRRLAGDTRRLRSVIGELGEADFRATLEWMLGADGPQAPAA